MGGARLMLRRTWSTNETLAVDLVFRSVVPRPGAGQELRLASSSGGMYQAGNVCELEVLVHASLLFKVPLP